jgi:hypothetical protein
MVKGGDGGRQSPVRPQGANYMRKVFSYQAAARPGGRALMIPLITEGRWPGRQCTIKGRVGLPLREVD